MKNGAVKTCARMPAAIDATWPHRNALPRDVQPAKKEK